MVFAATGAYARLHGKSFFVADGSSRELLLLDEGHRFTCRIIGASSSWSDFFFLGTTLSILQVFYDNNFSFFLFYSSLLHIVNRQKCWATFEMITASTT